MTVIGSDSIVGRSVRTAGYQVREIVHVCAIYLGIAVLVTTVLSAAVPSLREQARQIHEALVIALRPDGLEQDMLASFGADDRSEEHTSELQSLMRISYAVFCLKKKKNNKTFKNNYSDDKSHILCTTH